MVTDDLLAFYTYSKEVLYDESMGLIKSAFPIHHVDQCYLYNVSYEPHILEETLEILMDYSIEIFYSQFNESGALEKTSKKNQKSKIITLPLKQYPPLLEREEGHLFFSHWINTATYEAKIKEGNKIQVTVHANIGGAVTSRPYSNICVLERQEPLEGPQIWEDSVDLSKRLVEVRDHLDRAHQELNEKNYIIDGLIHILKEWEN